MNQTRFSRGLVLVVLLLCLGVGLSVVFQTFLFHLSVYSPVLYEVVVVVSVDVFGSYKTHFNTSLGTTIRLLSLQNCY